MKVAEALGNGSEKKHALNVIATLGLQSSSFWGSILESLTKERGDTQKGTTLEPLGSCSGYLALFRKDPRHGVCILGNGTTRQATGNAHILNPDSSHAPVEGR